MLSLNIATKKSKSVFLCERHVSGFIPSYVFVVMLTKVHNGPIYAELYICHNIINMESHRHV